jgi:hypothetical protein
VVAGARRGKDDKKIHWPCWEERSDLVGIKMTKTEKKSRKLGQTLTETVEVLRRAFIKCGCGFGFNVSADSGVAQAILFVNK